MKKTSLKSKGRKRPASRAKDKRLMRCDSLISAIGDLEKVLDSAAKPPAAQFLKLLGNVQGNVHEHVSLTEGKDGLLTLVDQHCPHLGRWAQRLRAEHSHLEKKATKLRLQVDRAKLDGWRPVSMRNVRAHATGLLNSLRKHQAEGTELVFEAFVSDIGTGD